MKILKPGEVEQRKFVCPRCGCIFVATPADEMYEFLDHYQCPQEGCGWYVTKTGYSEPYEEPTPTQTDRERLESLLANSPMGTEAATEYLLSHGVTFREG